MFKSSALVLIGVCGTVAPAAWADEIDVRANSAADQDLATRRDPYEMVARARSSAFGDRATISVNVFDNATNVLSFNRTSLGNCSHILEDISFGTGVYGPSYTGTRTLSNLRYSYGLTGGTAAWDIRLSFYRPNQVNFAGFSGDGSGMVDPSASPYYTLTITGFDTNICPGFRTISGLTAFPNPVTLPAGDTELMLDMAYVEPGTPGTAPLTSTNLFQTNLTTTRVTVFYGTNTNAFLNPVPPNTATTGAQSFATLASAGSPASPGYSHPQYGRDSSFDATFLGQSLVNSALGPAFPNSNERRYISDARTQAYVFLLQGEIEAPAPIAGVSIDGGNGFLPDGTSNVSDQLTPATPYRVYKFNVKNDVNYANTSFLDIDTENSDQPVRFAIYTPNSEVFDVAESRGSGPDAPPSAGGNNAFQISYGVARRPGVNNGEQYSGQEGTMPAGEYYLVVALNGTGFGDGWNITPVVPAAPVNFSLNLNGNNQLTVPAGPAVSPTLPTGGDLGILLGGPQVATSIAVRARGIGWVRWGLTNNIPTVGAFDQRDQVTPLSDVTFLDVTQPGSSIIGEWNFALYNNNGVLANATSISRAGAGYNGNNGGGDGPSGCSGTFAQLSYGTGASRGTAPLDAGHTNLGLPLNNQNGSALASDEYYLAVTLGTSLFASDRWGARSTRGSNLTASITVNSDNRGPSPACPADFNGDFGVDDSDFVIFARAYNNLLDLVGDINLDTLTDDGDFAEFSTAYDALLCP
ncbi:MAG TPA: hypothetical protein VF777_02760 [Phycisphaerales bacterium]